MLKAGQRPKQPLQVPAVSVEDHPPRFAVMRVFADRLRIGDVVWFRPNERPSSPLWAKTWRVVRVDKHTEDTRKIFVVEVQ